jgi:nitrogen-specific signal transduction histidine kinase
MNEPTQLQAMLSTHSEESLRDQLLFENLAAEINHLIQTDFERLVNLLYRIDVSEARLKEMLQANPSTDAGHVIARLLIERQIQKIKLRKEFAADTPPVNDEERW